MVKLIIGALMVAAISGCTPDPEACQSACGRIWLNGVQQSTGGRMEKVTRADGCVCMYPTPKVQP